MAEPGPSADTSALRERREKRALLSSSSALLGRGLSLLISLASVPLTLQLLGKERYGVWAVVSGVLGWLSLADMGLGNGVTNEISGAPDDRAKAQSVVTGAFVSIALISLVMLLVGVALLLLLPWRSVLAAPTLTDGELQMTVGICMMIFLLGFMNNPFERVFAAYQESYILQNFQLSAPVLLLLSLWLLSRSSPSMPLVVLVLSGIPLLPRLVGTGFLLLRHRPWLRPARAFYDASVSKRLTVTGVAFLIPQLAAIGVWEVDNLIILQTLGPGPVAVYATAFRLPTIFYGLLAMWVGPLLPAYAEAAARGDIAWVRQRHRRVLMQGMGLAVAGGVGLVALGPWVLGVWTRHQIQVDRALLLPMGVYLPIAIWCLILSIPLCGLGQLRGQSLYGSLSAVLNVLFSILLARRFGLPGVSWATSLAASISAVLAFFELERTLARREQGATT